MLLTLLVKRSVTGPHDPATRPACGAVSGGVPLRHFCNYDTELVGSLPSAAELNTIEHAIAWVGKAHDAFDEPCALIRPAQKRIGRRRFFCVPTLQSR